MENIIIILFLIIVLVIFILFRTVKEKYEKYEKEDTIDTLSKKFKKGLLVCKLDEGLELESINNSMCDFSYLTSDVCPFFLKELEIGLIVDPSKMNIKIDKNWIQDVKNNNFKNNFIHSKLDVENILAIIISNIFYLSEAKDIHKLFSRFYGLKLPIFLSRIDKCEIQKALQNEYTFNELFIMLEFKK